MPTEAIEICTGTAIFISFLTPESDVNVDEPVKFMAINDDMDIIIQNHDKFSMKDWPVVFNKNARRKTKTPASKPLKENARPGSKGNKTGVIKIPARNPKVILKIPGMPNSPICCNEIPFLLIADTINTTAQVISKYFLAL